MKNNRKKGFTIVELVIVIAVIAILVSILIPTFSGLITKANMTADASTVKTFNTYLAADEVENGKPQTMTQVVEVMDKYGYNLENFRLSVSGNKLLWNQDTNRFIIKNGDDVVYADSAENYKYWEIVDKIPAEKIYSMYLTKKVVVANDGVVNTTVGVDLGSNKTVKVINYNGVNEKQDIIIVTNSANVTLNINAYVNSADNTVGDKITHHGSLGKLVVTKTTMNDGYKEVGTTSYAKVLEGEVVAVAGGNIDVLFTTNADATKVAAIEKGGNIGAGYTTAEIIDTTNQNRNGGIALTYADEDGLITEQKVDIVGEEKVVETKAEEVSKDDDKTDMPANAVVYNVNKDTYYCTDETYENDIDALMGSINDANEKDTLVLLKDVQYYINGKGLINITKSLTINGGNHTISGNGLRGSNPTTIAINNNGTKIVDVTLKNLRVYNNHKQGRAIETRGNIGTLVLDNTQIKCTGASYPNTPQAITFGGNQSTVANFIVKNNSVIECDAYYAIITFNPLNMTIEDSKIIGWSSLYFKGVSNSEGSHNSIVNAKNSEFISINRNSGSSDAFGAIVFEDNNMTLNFENCKFDASQMGTAPQHTFLASSYATRKGNVVVNITGDKTVNKGNFLQNSWGEGQIVINIYGGTYGFEEWEAGENSGTIQYTKYPAPYNTFEGYANFLREQGITDITDNGDGTLTYRYSYPAGNNIEEYPIADGYKAVISQDRTTFSVVAE